MIFLMTESVCSKPVFCLLYSMLRNAHTLLSRSSRTRYTLSVVAMVTSQIVQDITQGRMIAYAKDERKRLHDIVKQEPSAIECGKTLDSFRRLWRYLWHKLKRCVRAQECRDSMTEDIQPETYDVMTTRAVIYLFFVRSRIRRA